MSNNNTNILGTFKFLTTLNVIFDMNYSFDMKITSCKEINWFDKNIE